MNTRSLILSFAFLFAGSLAAQTSPARLGALTTEHQQNPLGIGDLAPRLSWKILSDRIGEKQTAYEIRAASTAAGLKAGSGDLWSSGKVVSDQSVLVPWGGKSLASRAEVFWQVRVWDKDGVASAWSDPATFEIGLVNPAADWKGQWITVDLPRIDMEKDSLAKANWISAGAAANQAAGVRFVLNLPADAKIRGATIDAIADGVVSLYANGHSTLQGPTSHAAPFHANFGQHLVPGKNIIALGAAAVHLPTPGGRNAIAAHGVVELENGTRIEFNTDGAWKANAFPAPPARGAFGARGTGGVPIVPGAVGRRDAGAPGVARGAGAAAGGAAGGVTNTWYQPDFDDSSWTPATVLGLYNAQPLTGSNGSTIGAGRYLRKAFTVKGPVAKARLY